MACFCEECRPAPEVYMISPANVKKPQGEIAGNDRQIVVHSFSFDHRVFIFLRKSGFIKAAQ
jgi:hypothetical protein